MARRSIDMLPLIDVFMVVLFVFATVQEQQLDDSAHELARATATLAAAEVELTAQAERIKQSDADQERIAKRHQQLADEARELRGRVREYERVCGPRRPDGPVCPAVAAVSAEAKTQAAMAALHERLLDNVAVFEIELEGEPDFEAGVLPNRCCYRSDPSEDAWKPCGLMPSDRAAQLAWLDAGADGLLDGLSRTRGGNAVVVIRQSEMAGYNVSNKLAALLGERFPNYRIYDDSVSTGPLACPLLTR